MFASALGRSVFIEHLIKILDEQIDSAMAQIGCTSLDRLDKRLYGTIDGLMKLQALNIKDVFLEIREEGAPISALNYYPEY